MTTSKEYERVGGLINAASSQSKSFLKKCSKTKFLAVDDYYRASDQYVELAKEILNAKSLGIQNQDSCQASLSSIRSALELGQLDAGFLTALQDLRSRYLEDVLKPAFKEYIRENSEPKNKLETFYLNAMKIDGLVETIQFMNKIQPED